MPDDDYRPTHGLPPDSRTNVPPDWWSLLDRRDLPAGDGETVRTSHRRSRETDVLRILRGRAGRHPRWLRWATTVTLIAIAGLLVAAVLDPRDLSGIAAVLIFVGILTFLTLLGIQVTRGTHRHR